MPNTQFRLSMLSATVTALFAPPLFAAGAGQVDFATAGVNAIGPNGQSRPLTRGSEIAPGETIDTGTGRAQLRFTDGGFVSLQPQTQFRIETYGYDKDDPKQNSIVMNLLKGGLRTITGLIGKTNREGYKLQTSTATVGIRGTEFSITGFPDGSILFHVADGAIDVANQAGSSTLNGGQSATVSNQNSPPAKTDDKPFLPPVVLGAQTQIPLPTNATQDSQPAIAQTQPLLTGTFAGQWRTATINTSSSNNPGSNIQPPPDNGYGGALPTFTLSPSGHLTSFGYGTPVGPNPTSTVMWSLGAAGAQSYGNDGVMAWGRWTGGPTSYADSSGTKDDATYPTTDPLHYVVGLPVTNLPTSGSATYNMYGGTAPSCSGPSCGAISVGMSVTVNFGVNTGSFNLAVANSGDGVKLAGSGGLSFDRSGVNFNGNASMSSSGAPIDYGYGSGNVNGFLAGPGASHAGAVYNVNYSVAGNYTTIVGAAALKK